MLKAKPLVTVQGNGGESILLGEKNVSPDQLTLLNEFERMVISQNTQH